MIIMNKLKIGVLGIVSFVASSSAFSQTEKTTQTEKNTTETTSEDIKNQKPVEAAPINFNIKRMEVGTARRQPTQEVNKPKEEESPVEKK